MTFPTTWINLKGIMLSEGRQTLYDFTYMCNLKKISKKKKNRNRPIDTQNKHMGCQRGGDGETDNIGKGD